MKKNALIFLLVLFQNFNLALSAVPTKLFKPQLAFEAGQKNDLALLCRIWGMLKYHHPAVIRGDFDWDQELIKILPAYRSSKDKAERNKVLLTWINNFGPVPESPPISDSLLAIAKLKPDHSWIRKSKLSPQLVDILASISNYHSTSDQKYIKYLAEDDIVIPSFINEEAYTQMTYPSADYRLLSVFRYWNIIEFWYPYKYLAKQKWEDCLSPFIEEALAAKDESAFVHLTQKMVSTIQDSHAVLNFKKLDEYNGLWVMPFTVKFIEGKAVVNSINSKAPEVGNIEIGNIIQAINGVSIAKIIENKKPYLSASNEAIVLREVAKLLSRSSDSTSKLTIENNQGKRRLLTVKNIPYIRNSTVKAYDFPYQKDSTFFILPQNVLYVNAGTLKNAQVDIIIQHLKTAKGMVLDARQYPRTGAGSVTSLLQKALLAEKAAMSKFSSVVKGYPGFFKYAKPFVIGEANPDHFKGKIAILVNEETQSTGEFLTMAYQLAPNAKVIGSSTAGADGNVTYPFALPGGFVTQITGLGVYYPNGKETQQIGIVADIRVKQTIIGFRNHEDDLLNKAVDVITKK